MRSDLQCMQAGLAAVDDFFDGVFAPLKVWVPELRAALESAGGKVSGADLAELVRPGALSILESQERPLFGTGFCGSEAIISQGNPLAWWQGPDRRSLETSAFGFGEAALDLERMEWYRVPRQTGQPHVAGPFVDYLCSDEITLTSAVPLVVDGEFWGVACADVLVARLEEVLPTAGETVDAALVNAHGRVVVSMNPDRETGDRMPGVCDCRGGTDDQLAVVRSERYPFAIAMPRV